MPQVSRRKPTLETVNASLSRANASRSTRDIADAIITLADYLGCGYAEAETVVYNRTGLSAPKELSSRGYIPQYQTAITSGKVMPPKPKRDVVTAAGVIRSMEF